METGYGKNTGNGGQLCEETDLELSGKNTSTFKLKQSG
jgi:hypothetical protein